MADPSQSRARVDAVMRAYRQGRIVLIEDTARPQRGGILAVAAHRTSDDTINYLVTHARGMIAVALPPERIEAMGLELQGTGVGLDRENYAVSVEARDGVSTGISASDRARTVQVIGDRKSRSDDICTPGHVFPVHTEPGGVMVRAGWAEACLDLAAIAGDRIATCFSQILGDDGELALGAGLHELAERHGLPMVSIGDIAAWRMATESFVSQQTQAALPTQYGEMLTRVFIDELDGKQHVALTLGDIRTSEPVLVRLHSECLTGDVFGSQRCDCGEQLRVSFERIVAEGRGVILYLRQEGRGIGLINKIKAYALQDAGRDTVEANLELGLPVDQRDFGIGAQVLTALGVRKVRLLTNNPRKIEHLERFGIEVTKREPIEVPVSEHALEYLETKRTKLGHLLTQP